MATLKDISKKSGFSTSTVCYALNNDHRIPEDTRNKINKVADELHYSKRRGGTNNTDYRKQIVFCVNSINGIIYTELYDAIYRVLTLSHCKVMIYVGSHITDIPWMDGLIVLNSNVLNEDIREVVYHKIPVVVMDRDTFIDGATNVTLDNYNGIYQLTKKVLQKGAQTFAFVGGPQKSFESNERYSGFKAALTERHIRPLEQPFYRGDFTSDSGYTIGETILVHNLLPDAIICANDEMALGIISALEDYSIDYSKTLITGFDGSASKKQLGFITCRCNRVHWGSVAAYTLLQMFDKRKSDHIKITLDVVEY